MLSFYKTGQDEYKCSTWIEYHIAWATLWCDDILVFKSGRIFGIRQLSQYNDMNVGMNIPRTIHYLADEVIELQKPLYNEETGYIGIAVVDKSRTRDKGTTEEFDLDMNPVVPEPFIDKK